MNDNVRSPLIAVIKGRNFARKIVTRISLTVLSVIDSEGFGVPLEFPYTMKDSFLGFRLASVICISLGEIQDMP